jgi:hypothetical protein
LNARFLALSYSANLNPIERLWKIMHEQVTYDKYYQTFKAAKVNLVDEKILIKLGVPDNSVWSLSKSAKCWWRLLRSIFSSRHG